MALNFKKTCFECGSKVDKLYNGVCIDCFQEENPPIKEIKQLNVKICNMCKKIHHNNQLLKVEDFEKLLENIMKKKVILNKGYTLKELKISDFEVVRNKICFNLKVNTNLE